MRNVYKNEDTREYQEIRNNIVKEVEYEFLARFANISEDGKTVEIKEEHQFNESLVAKVQQVARKFIGEGNLIDLNEFKDSLITSKIDDLGPIVKQMIFNNENKTEVVEELDTFTNNHSDSIRVYDILKIDVEREREKGQFGPSEIITQAEKKDEDTTIAQTVPKNTNLIDKDELTAFQNDVRNLFAENNIATAVSRIRTALATGSDGTLGVSPLARLYGYFADNKEEQEMRAKNKVAFDWWNSNKSSSHFLDEATKEEFEDAINDPINYYYNKIATKEQE